MSDSKLLATILTVTAAAGCIPIAGDGAFRVHGEIAAAESCELQLFPQEGEGEALQTIKVLGQFRETFVVDPRPRTYQLEIWCAGERRRTYMVDYGGTVTYDTLVEVGILAL